MEEGRDGTSAKKHLSTVGYGTSALDTDQPSGRGTPGDYLVKVAG